jgi:hypothetical protein
MRATVLFEGKVSPPLLCHSNCVTELRKLVAKVEQVGANESLKAASIKQLKVAAGAPPQGASRFGT